MNFFDHIVKIVRKIPNGKVATYGQIAVLAGNPRAARTVGWALHQLEHEDLRVTPWHRVVNRQGRISTTCEEHTAAEQAALLKKEGIRVQYKDGNYYIELSKYLWKDQ